MVFTEMITLTTFLQHCQLIIYETILKYVKIRRGLTVLVLEQSLKSVRLDVVCFRRI